MTRFALAFALLALPAHAGGIGQHTPPDDPCPVGFVLRNDGSMTDEMFRQWLSVRAMTCPHQVEEKRHRITGLLITDADKLRWAFDGSTIPRISVIPLPAGVWLLLAGLGALVVVRGRRG